MINRSILSIIEVSKGDMHPPLYPILLSFWSQIFGQSEIGLRSLSVVFGMLTVFGVYLIAKKTFEQKNMVILAILLAATNPMLIYYSQEVRNYSMVTALVAGLVYCALTITRKSDPKWFVLFGVFGIAGLYTNSLFIIILFGLLLFYLINYFWGTKYNQRPKLTTVLKFLTPILVTYCIIILSFLPWIAVLLAQIKSADKSFWFVFDPVNDLFRNTTNFFTTENYDTRLTNGSWFFRIYTGYFGVLLVILGVIHELRAKLIKSSMGLITFIFLGTAFLVSFRSPIYYIRYLIFAVPTMMLLCARGCQYLLSIIPRQKAMFLISTFVLFSTLFFVFNIKDDHNRENFGAMAQYLRSQQPELILHPIASSTWDSLSYYTQKNNLSLNSKVYSPLDNEPRYMKAILEPKDYYPSTIISVKNFWSVGGWNDEYSQLEFKAQGFCVKNVVKFQERLEAVNWARCKVL